MALVSTELVLRGADGDLALREPAGDLAPPAVSPERDTKALRGDPACYARALEQTVEAQQQEIRRGRAAVDAAEAEALAAARAAEATKTELINARSTYAMRVAELRACAAETDDRVAAAVAEAKAHARRAEGRAAEEADRADREVRRGR
ncbi:methyltransferase domain-containing protein [Aureococcus anophagefferens]|nr:methyltransferase domain-containing protein [Aureococcus anophagefferens]